MQIAGFIEPDDAYVLLLDGSGAVQWKYHGAVTDTSLSQLRAQFAAVR
jgi:hypothetical protein